MVYQISTPSFESVFVTLTNDNEENFENVTLLFEKYSLVPLKMVFRDALRNGSSRYLEKNHLIHFEIFHDEVGGSSENFVSCSWYPLQLTSRAVNFLGIVNKRNISFRAENLKIPPVVLALK